jgi:RNA polymerase sigma-70 factor (ECF subfamily)
MGAMRLFLFGVARTRADAAEQRLNAAIDEHFDFIWRLLRRLGLRPADADDAAQHVFMIATQKMHAIAPGSERSFLYGTAVRVASNARRAEQRRREDSDEALTRQLSSSVHPEQRQTLDEAWALLDELLDRLPGELRRVLVLADIEQVEVAEIASLEAIPVGTAASRLRRARDAFGEELKRSSARNPFAPGDK